MTLHDRIKGAIYGYALGDALGLGTEFMTREEAKVYYPDGCRDFTQIIRDGHRARFKPGEWTNDTELLLGQMEQALVDRGFNVRNQAKAFNEACDRCKDEIYMNIRLVRQEPGWLDDPVQKTHEVWKRYKMIEAVNDATSRGLLAALISSRKDLELNSRLAVRLTNDDTRSITSTLLIACMAFSLLHTGEPAPYQYLADLCAVYDSRVLSFLDFAYKGTLEDMELDDEETQQSTRKTMGAALWTVWHCDNAEDSIYKVIDQGGDADSNAAVAGAFAGLRFGYDVLPAIKEKLLKKDYLDDLAERMTALTESLGQ